MSELVAEYEKERSAQGEIPMLLVEDDELVADALKLTLSQHGFRVVRCEDASEALEQLRAGLAPRLIMLDLWTPNMDGWQFRIEQRRDPFLAEIPVIAMSGDRSPMATAIDAEAFLAKPIDDDVLLETVTQVLVRTDQLAKLIDNRRETDLRNALYLTRGALANMGTHVHALATEVAGVTRARAQALRTLLEQAQDLSALAEEAVSGGKPHPGAPRAAHAPQAAALRKTNVADVLRQSLLRMAFELSPQTLIQADFAPDATALADPRKLDHVFVNLLRNAAQAMASEVQQELQLSIWHGEDDLLHVSISDSGCGLEPALHERIFDAFYAVGPNRAALGLGLTVARRMVEEMGGSLDVLSAPEIGSTFRLCLRRDFLAADELAQATVRATRPSMLLIDNDPASLECRRQALTARFRVSAMSMWEGLQHLFEGAAYDMVLCDTAPNELQALSFFATMTLRYPEQAGRVVLLRSASVSARRRKGYDEAGIWHVEHLPPHELADKLARLMQLWRSLKLRTPQPRSSADRPGK
jgi:signal transduction histidine kinase